MYIVNTTFVVEPPVHGRWYELLTSKLIPFLREKGFGSPLAPRSVVLTRVLTDTGDAHYTYSLQVEVPDTGEYQRFMEEVLGEYNSIAGPLFGDQALHFTSLLKHIPITSESN